MAALASVVIPAHNEERGILRTLTRLHEGLGAEELDIVVVCNGCTDETADTVRAEFPSVRVLEIAEPSKAAAVAVGNAATEVFPRVHLDADVHLSGSSLRAMVDAVGQDGTLAAAPRRLLASQGCPPLVRWYYEFWEQLPQVRRGLFGRGVFALSAEGQRRVSALPRLMSDDLAMSEAFSAGERSIVTSAEAVVVPPGTIRDLLRRRVRVATGNAQATALGARGEGATTSLATVGVAALRVSLGVLCAEGLCAERTVDLAA